MCKWKHLNYSCMLPGLHSTCLIMYCVTKGCTQVLEYGGISECYIGPFRQSHTILFSLPTKICQSHLFTRKSYSVHEYNLMLFFCWLAQKIWSDFFISKENVSLFFPSEGPEYRSVSLRDKYDNGRLTHRISMNEKFHFSDLLHSCTSQVPQGCLPSSKEVLPKLHIASNIKLVCLPSKTGVPTKLQWCASQVKLVCLPSYTGVPPK